MRRQILTAVLIVLLGLFHQNEVDGCSCSRSHPQEHYCKSDFGELLQSLVAYLKTKKNEVALFK